MKLVDAGLKYEVWCDEDDCDFRLEGRNAELTAAAAEHVSSSGHTVLGQESLMLRWEP